MVRYHWCQFKLVSLLFILARHGLSEISAFPADINLEQSGGDDLELLEEYATLKHGLIFDYGYTKEFADLVETNLRRAVKEEKARQKSLSVTVPSLLRQGNQQPFDGSNEDDDDESTTPAITTPGPSPGDVVRGIAGIVTSLGSFNPSRFWASFVNFFPPNQRESAQAVVDASLGKRPAQWPTLPTTTTKLTTTTKDEDEIDSEETTKSAAVSAVVATAQPGLAPAAAITSAPAAVGVTPTLLGYPSAPSVAATETPTRAPTTKYMLIRRRPVPALLDGEGLRVDDHFLLGESFIPVLSTTSDTKTAL